MKFTLTLSLDNADAQYEDGSLNEQALAGYLEQAAGKVRDYETRSASIRDGNGNTIGEYAVSDD